jgi:hypothetical protein
MSVMSVETARTDRTIPMSAFSGTSAVCRYRTVAPVSSMTSNRVPWAVRKTSLSGSIHWRMKSGGRPVSGRVMHCSSSIVFPKNRSVDGFR